MMKYSLCPSSLQRRGARATLLAVGLSWMLAAAPSSAQTPADKAAAQALFDNGKRLMDEGKYAEACARFEESQRLDAGVGTLYQLAACQEKIGRTASAWALYLEVASLTKASGQKPREDWARAQAARLEPELPRLVVRVEGAAAEGFSVERDGAVLGKAQWGIPVPIDPGAHVVEVKVEGYRPFREVVDARPGQTATVVVRAEAQKKTTPPVVTPAPARNPWRIASYATGGAGLAALAAGIGFGLSARAKNDASMDRCPDNRCYPDGAALRNDALYYGDVGTGFIVAGAALVGAGVGFFFLKPPSPDEAGKKVSFAPWVGPSQAGIVLEGRLR